MSDRGDIQGLLAAMRQKAEDERKRLDGSVDQEIGELERQVERKTGEESLKARGALEGDLRKFAEKLEGENILALDHKRLEIKWAILDEVFRKAGEALGGGETGAGYREIVIRLAEEALRVLGAREAEHDPAAGQCVLKVRKEDAGFTAAHFAGIGFPVTVEGVEGGPGTITALSSDGLRLADNGFATRLSRLRSHLPDRVCGVLFAGDRVKGR
jgi:vacuolar-type H+-ATPase subunit E/Vma4